MKNPKVSLADLTQQCAQETDRFFHGEEYDPQHCFELFRLAIVEGEQFAWEAIYTQYKPLVGRWIQQHSGFETSGEEIQYFINRSFEKIWGALSPEKFRQFPDLGYLLRYLKMCVHSVITDYNRLHELAMEIPLIERSSIEIADQHQALEDWTLDRMQRMRFWEALNQRLNDEKERQVIYGSFMLALKPRELIDVFPNLFADVDEVYRIKQNILARLRRDSQFGEIIDQND